MAVDKNVDVRWVICICSNTSDLHNHIKSLKKKKKKGTIWFKRETAEIPQKQTR